MAVEPIITVPYTEFDDSPNESFNPSLSATMQLQCAWNDRHTLARELVGGTQTQAGVTVTTLPWLYPHDSEGKTRVVGISGMRPEGSPTANSSDSQIMNWNKALLTVQFATEGAGSDFTSSPDSNFLIEDTFGGFSETLFVASGKAGGASLWWAHTETVSGDDVRVPLNAEESPTKRIQGFRWTRRIRGLDLVPASIILQSGSVNDRPYTIPSYVFAGGGVAVDPETLLFESFQTADIYNSEGERKVDLSLNFVFQYLGTSIHNIAADLDGAGAAITKGGWNHAFAPGSAQPERIMSSTSADEFYKAYTPINFETLLNPIWT